MIGIIGGSGLYELPNFQLKEQLQVDTPFGSPSDQLVIGELAGKRVVFIARHGRDHDLPPHRVNYRANVWAMKEAGVERIIGVNAVGGISPEVHPGMIVVPEQVVDFTVSRQRTFYDGPEVVHVDFTEPYCPELRAIAKDKTAALAMDAYHGGTYVCTEGPRLESRAEIEFYLRQGWTVVGMTAMPEAVLAREQALCYLTISVVTNPAAGLTGRKLTTDEVVQTMRVCTEQVKTLLGELIQALPRERTCPCKDALQGAKM